MPHGWNDSVHQALGSFIDLLCGERDKGSGRAPLVNPRGPARKSVLRTALTSRVPDCGRLDSTYSFHAGTRFTRPIHGTRPFGASASAVQNCSRQFCPCLGSPLSAIHGVQTLSFPLRFADFSGDTTPRCHIVDKSKAGIAETLPDGASLIRPTGRSGLVGRIRRSRHPAAVPR